MFPVVGILAGRLWLVLASAAALLLVGVGATVYNQHANETRTIRETEVQARILASTVTAALSFSLSSATRDFVDYRSETQEYVDALRRSPEIEAAAVYDARGDLVASFAETPMPRRLTTGARTGFVDNRVFVMAPVTAGGQHVGDVVLRTRPEPFAQMLGRYSPVGLLLLMGLLVIGVLGVSQNELSRANRELTRRAGELADAYKALQVQMGERERAEIALRQSQKMEAIGRLTGGVAHDFNNLLMVASSGLELMDRTDDPARRALLKEGVMSAVQRGANLTRQLLTFARKNPLKPEVIDPGHRVQGLRLLVEQSLGGGVMFELELAAELWPVEIDAGQLDVALLNIAVNARDAMPEGGSFVVRVENLEGVEDGDLVGDYVCISARDTGRGIPEELIAKVVEPFFTTKGVGKGTGLGLSQVYGFCQSSGGDLRIESEEGAGATVRLFIPRSRKDPSCAGQDESKAPRPVLAPAARVGRVLLVEDDPEVAAVVIDMFQSLGWETERAVDAPSGLQRLESADSFDLLFSDMVMPGGLGGLDLARMAAQLRPDLTILLTTGYSEAAMEAAEQGVRVLQKPYDLNALSAELERVFSSLDEPPVKPRRRGVKSA